LFAHAQGDPGLEELQVDGLLVIVLDHEFTVEAEIQHLFVLPCDALQRTEELGVVYELVNRSHLERLQLGGQVVLESVSLPVVQHFVLEQQLVQKGEFSADPAEEVESLMLVGGIEACLHQHAVV